MCKKFILVLGVLVVALMVGTAQAALIHQYTFNDLSTAKDDVGTADGILMNGATVNNDASLAWVSCDGVDDFVDLVGANIAINTLTDGFTLKLWSKQPDIDQGYSMTAVFGATRTDGAGTDFVAISTARGDQVSRGMICDGSGNPSWWGGNEMGVNGPELNDGQLHLYSVVVGPGEWSGAQGMYISYYMDDKFMGALNMFDGRTISMLSNDLAYLGKGTYTGDATMLVDIVEFSIYDEALSGSAILANYAAGPTPVPEPTTIVLLGLGSLALIRRRKS